jgi:hypothetical protein
MGKGMIRLLAVMSEFDIERFRRVIIAYGFSAVILRATTLVRADVEARLVPA